MSGILVFLLLLSGLFVLLIVVGILWSIRTGQFDDLEGPAARILMDDDDPRLPTAGLSGTHDSPTISTSSTEHTQ